MKKLLRLSLALTAIVLISTSSTPKTAAAKKTTYGFYVQNGTAWGGTVTGYGAIYTPSPVAFGTSSVYFIQTLSPGTSYLTVTITCGASGTHTYGLTGGVSPAPTPVTTASGTVTFTSVNVVPGDINAYIH